MPDLNNTLSLGCSYESNEIYLEEIHLELMEIQWKCSYFLDLEICHGMTSLLSFLIFVCPLPHLCHLLTPSDLVCLPSAASTPTPRCTHATMLCPHSD